MTDNPPLGASGGIPLTPALLNDLVAEAEAGYDPDRLHPRHHPGRTPTMSPVQVRIVSFGFDHGDPPTADLTVDLRRLFRSPYYPAPDPRLNGLSPRVVEYVMDATGVRRLTANMASTAADLVADTADRRHPADVATEPVLIAVGDSTGRQHCVVVATALAAHLQFLRISVETTHRHLHTPAPAPPEAATPDDTIGGDPDQQTAPTGS